MEAALPADIAVCAAAVADWRVAETAAQKMKKTGAAPALLLTENPDILARFPQPGRTGRGWWSASPPRPKISWNIAAAKRARKNCDWIVANDVGGHRHHGRRGE